MTENENIFQKNNQFSFSFISCHGFLHTIIRYCTNLLIVINICRTLLLSVEMSVDYHLVFVQNGWGIKAQNRVCWGKGR